MYKLEDLEKYSPDKGIRLLFQELFGLIEPTQSEEDENFQKSGKILNLVNFQYYRIRELDRVLQIRLYLEDGNPPNWFLEQYLIYVEDLENRKLELGNEIEIWWEDVFKLCNKLGLKENPFSNTNMGKKTALQEENPLWAKTRNLRRYYQIQIAGLEHGIIQKENIIDLHDLRNWIEKTKAINHLYQEWLNDKDRDPWDPSKEMIDLEERMNTISGRNFQKTDKFLRIRKEDLQDQEEYVLNEKEKLYNLLKLEKRDMRGQDDISKDWDDIFEVCRLIAEISRFAILDLGSERDDNDEYVPFSSDKENEGRIFGNKGFHTSSFRNWVRNKSNAILPNYGFSKEIIDRGLNAVLTIDPKKKKESGDSFIADIYNLGELMHVSNGATRPTLSRLVELKDSVFMIVSSLPTYELRMIDPNIILEGCMRFTKNSKLAEFLPIQDLNTYSQPPLRLVEVFEEDSADKQREIAKKLLIGDALPLKLDKIYRPEDEQTFEYVKNGEKFTGHHQAFKAIGLEKIPVLRNYGVIRILQQFKSNRYFIVVSDNKRTYADASYYSIPPTYWRYICRIFHERPKLQYKINKEKVILRLSENLPSRGQRIMASTQTLGAFVRRSSDFKVLQKGEWKRDDGSKSMLEWNINIHLWESYVKEYLTKFCLYELEEIK